MALCDVPDRKLVIECGPRRRRGIYDLQRLMRRYGEHSTTIDLYLRCTQSCRWQTEIGGRRPDAYSACRVKIVDDGARMPSNPRSRS